VKLASLSRPSFQYTAFMLKTSKHHYSRRRSMSLMFQSSLWSHDELPAASILPARVQLNVQAARSTADYITQATSGQARVLPKREQFCPTPNEVIDEVSGSRLPRHSHCAAVEVTSSFSHMKKALFPFDLSNVLPLVYDDLFRSWYWICPLYVFSCSRGLSI